jgi:hypothetical protein
MRKPGNQRLAWSFSFSFPETLCEMPDRLRRTSAAEPPS